MTVGKIDLRYLEAAAPTTASIEPRLIVFSDDWGRHPSSSQHLVRHLLADYRVDWINTIGTRRPTLSWRDARRSAATLRRWLIGTAEQATATSLPIDQARLNRLHVHTPVHWPGFGRSWERRLNRLCMVRAIAPLLTPRAPRAIITTVPIVADLAAAFPSHHWIYYCVDDLAERPGLDGATLRRMEKALLPRVARIVVVSDALGDRLARLGFDSVLLTHGIDLDLWQQPVKAPLAPTAAPLAVYWGYADGRLDSAICLAVADRCRLRMIGPRGAVDRALLHHPAIEWHDPVPYTDLPAVAAEADVLVMPYADLPVTRAMQPLKLKEYLATGRPVVATPLPANRAWAASLDLTDEPAAFARRVVDRARTGLPDSQQADRRRLVQESWAAKAQCFARWLELGP